MKALILAGGLGQRLLPYTLVRPKPMFTLGGKPVLKIIIENLIQAGCKRIIINTHHLYEQINEFIQTTKFPIHIETRHEKRILGTGGAIKNVQDFMLDSQFFVINSDIISNVNLKNVWDFHSNGNWLATLVLHDYPRFNKVLVNKKKFILDFFKNIDLKEKILAFTGIQVLSSEIFSHMPHKKKFTSIKLYKDLIDKGDYVKAYKLENIYFNDIGTYEDYQRESIRYTAETVFQKEKLKRKTDLKQVKNYFSESLIKIKKLLGDGSDRLWFRTTNKDDSLIITNYGINIKCHNKTREIDSFINIGKHLFACGISVPRIRKYDLFSGVVALDDLGDIHLQKIINAFSNSNEIFKYYKKVCNQVIDFSINGVKGFKSSWTHQGYQYSKEIILKKECQYFIEAFIQDYLKKNIKFTSLKKEFEFIAENALEFSFWGLMHKDMQSRNIMVKNGKFFFIDFQDAIKGPLQYDLASLIIDPYVDLNIKTRENLLNYCAQRLNKLTGFNEKKFKKGFRFCAVIRNMQILGAFSYLTQKKNKVFFKQYIPCAKQRLKETVEFLTIEKMPELKKLVNSI
ncbi:MAG: hypothetical protein B6I26_08560 [Desulfobacteraceae bacterium 4572_130]|nr:MAG: hypothetical protein B6I26_08560 [Desulfobacteraceae bacterium 4572_130]